MHTERDACNSQPNLYTVRWALGLIFGLSFSVPTGLATDCRVSSTAADAANGNKRYVLLNFMVINPVNELSKE
jgi:hypothetical protein